jgi:hypothetical protein
MLRRAASFARVDQYRSRPLTLGAASLSFCAAGHIPSGEGVVLKRLLALLLPLLAIAFATPAVADHDGVVRFATLPKPGPGFPEGIAADHRGRIFVATFDFTNPNVIYVFDHNGRLDETISLPTGVVPLGMDFDRHGNLYVANFGGGTILKFRPPFNSGSVPTHTFAVCGGAGAGCGLNAITFDGAGDLYVSDSFGGNVFKIDLPAGTVSTFIDGVNPLYDDLKPGNHGFPPFGPTASRSTRRGRISTSPTRPTTASSSTTSPRAR